MIQSPDYHTDDSCQPEFSYPPIQVAEHRGAPLVSWSGLAIIRQLVERLGVAPAIDAAVRVLRRCKWYTESDHILTMIYNMLTGGSTLSDINRFRDDPGVKRLLGTERIPHATTTGDFLARFGEDRNALALSELREVGEDLQQQSFAMLPRARRAVATIDLDSSIHEVYGEKKEGADFAYNNTWSYSVLYGTLAETGDLLYMDLREGYRYTSYGSKDVLPGMIKRVGEHFRAVRMRADSGYYDQKLVQICAARGVEFFIVAKKHAECDEGRACAPGKRMETISEQRVKNPPAKQVAFGIRPLKGAILSRCPRPLFLCLLGTSRSALSFPRPSLSYLRSIPCSRFCSPSTDVVSVPDSS